MKYPRSKSIRCSPSWPELINQAGLELRSAESKVLWMNFWRKEWFNIVSFCKFLLSLKYGKEEGVEAAEMA